MEPKKTDIKKGILNRVKVLYGLFFVIGLLIIGKIIYLQYGPQSVALRSKGTTITYERMAIEADRGDILAVDGRLLATSVPEYEIRMDFAAQGLVDSIFMRQVDSLAYCLSNFFGDRTKAAYKVKLLNAYRNKKKNRYTMLSPRRVNHLELKEIRRFPIFRLGKNRGGLITVQINRRLLPHGSMAKRTIGMVNQTGTKVGIEGAFDTLLRGVDGNVLMQRISGNFRIPVPDEMNVDPVDGIDVLTTLDVDVQDVAEKALRDQLETMQADWGTAILMEVSTGEIRAMTNLTRHGEGDIVEDYNYAIGMNMEPGSTQKLASLVTLLDDAGASLDEKFDTGNGTAIIGRTKVTDTHGYGVLTLKGVFEKSSNIGFAKAVNKYYRDDPKRFVDHLYKMGLNLPLEMQIAGAQKPVIRRPGDRWWDGTTLTNMAYGYALLLTPLKTLTFYNAIANSGKMVSPLLVKELRQYGQTLRAYHTKVMVEQVASERVVKMVREAMRAVVEEGTGRVLKSPYYKVGGKTGTAQIPVNGRYTDRNGGRHYLATMVGYFPEDNPKYSCLVAIKTYNAPGHHRFYYGASLAGPVFRAIADRVYAKNTGWQIPVEKRLQKSDEHPPMKSGNSAEMREVAYRFDLPNTTYPKEGWQQVARVDSTKIFYSECNAPLNKVPSVIGMGLKDALYLLERRGLKVTFSGEGAVVAQSVPRGANVYKGMIIALRLGCDPLKEGLYLPEEEQPADPDAPKQEPSEANDSTTRLDSTQKQPVKKEKHPATSSDNTTPNKNNNRINQK